VTFKIVRVTVENFATEAANKSEALKTPWTRIAKTVVANHVIPISTQPAVSPTVSAVWPIALRGLRLFAKPGDRGAGDIIARVLGPIGGNVFKKWWKKATGRNCGCNSRQAKLNRRYPLLN
jgi:hypothetical protein